MIKIPLRDRLTGEQEMWLAKHIGPRMHYLHNSIGGQGWIANYEWTAQTKRQWVLTLEDDKYATLFTVMFS